SYRALFALSLVFCSRFLLRATATADLYTLSLHDALPIYAKSLVLTLEQARHDVGLPSRFRASITVGARIALWEGFLPQWVGRMRSEEHTSELQSRENLVCRLLLEKKKKHETSDAHARARK